MSDILQYIPQRPPFAMIDHLINADDGISKTSFTIPEDHLFIENGHFTERGLVENMAQTAAAGTGYKAQQIGNPAPIGFIGALKNLNIFQLPKASSTIITTVQFGMQVMNAQIVNARIEENGKEIANCELKIFIQQ